MMQYRDIEMFPWLLEVVFTTLPHHFILHNDLDIPLFHLIDINDN